MKLRKSLANSFILIVLLILIIGQGSLWTWFLFTQKKHNMRMLTDKMQNISRLLSNLSVDALMVSNYDYLDQYLEWFSSDEDIISIKILDTKGNILREKTVRAEDESKSLNPFFVPGSNKLRAPIKEIAFIEITYSGRSVNEEMKTLLTIPPLGQLLIFLLMIYAVYYFFQRKVGKPVNMLQENMKSVTAGNLTVEIPEIGRDELGIIASGLRFLVSGLLRTVRKLHSTADNVAMAIRQLQLTFENVTKAIQRQSSSVDSIFQSLKNAHESQKKITDSTESLSESSSENVTSLLQMKSIADVIAENTGKLFEASEKLYSVVAELSQTAKTMAENAENILSAIEDTLASVEEINASVKEVEHSAKESSSLAENVRELTATRGIFTIADAIEGMEKISDKVKYSVEIVRRLGTRSKDIEKMLSVIKDVTEQTNLLSLNAAILAAQAGEYGKGFSVVADEIRALSNRTAASTKEITAIVRTIQAEIVDVVSSIETGMEFVETGSSLVYSAGESIATVLEAAQKSARMAKSIEKATAEQVKGLGQITSSVNTIREMVTQATKATNEQFKSAEYMLEGMGEIKEISESTKKGTEEQAEGTRLISRNLELATGKIAEISKSALSQQRLNEGIISNMEQIRSIGNATIRDVEALTLSLSTLQEEINILRKEMESFKVK